MFDTIPVPTIITLSSTYLGRAMSYNTADSNDYDVQQAFMNQILTGRQRSSLGDYGGTREATTNLQTEIPTGATSISFLWDLGPLRDNPNPVHAEHAIRHNLDTLSPGTYTVSTTSMTGEIISSNRTVATIPQTASIVSVVISGPAGPMPSGWFIEMVRTSDEANYDNSSLHPAQRTFRPEFLNLWVGLNTDHIRFMKQTGTEENWFENPADLTVKGMYSYRTRLNFGGSDRVVMPVGDAVDLCNYLECGIYWTTGHRTTETLHKHLAGYISDNLDAGLPIYFEHYNEAWNFVYSGLKWFGAIANSRFYPQGAGTVSITSGSDQITATGVDLTTVFDATTNRITVGNYCYDVDPSTVTASTAEIQYADAFETVVDGPYWPTDNVNHDQGYAIEANKAANWWVEELTAKGDRERLVTTIGIRTADDGWIDEVMNPTNWSSSDTDWVDPQTAGLWDAAATNAYFGGGSFSYSITSPNAWADHIRNLHVASPGSAAPELRDYLMGRHATYSDNRDLPGIRDQIKLNRADCDTYGLRLLNYEAGQHAVSHGPFDMDHSTMGAYWQDVYDEWVLFMESDEWIEVAYEISNIQIAYNDGPVNKFQSIQEWGKYGTFSEVPYYGYNASKEITVHDELRAKPSFWQSTDQPLGALGIPKIFLTAGVVQTVDLNDYFSMNTDTFSTASTPSGMTLNTTTGVLSGTPSASSGNHIFTGTNVNGSDTVTLEINVS